MIDLDTSILPCNLSIAGTPLGVETTRNETKGPVGPAGAPDAPDAPDALRCPAMPCDAPDALRSPDFELKITGGISKHAKNRAKDDRNLLIAVRGKLLKARFMVKNQIIPGESTHLLPKKRKNFRPASPMPPMPCDALCCPRCPL